MPLLALILLFQLSPASLPGEVEVVPLRARDMNSLSSPDRRVEREKERSGGDRECTWGCLRAAVGRLVLAVVSPWWSSCKPLLACGVRKDPTDFTARKDKDAGPPRGAGMASVILADLPVGLFGLL